jgi:hypothetical protein
MHWLWEHDNQHNLPFFKTRLARRPVPTENSIQPSDTCTYKNYLLILSTSIPNSDFVIILLFEDKDLCGERYSGNEQGPEK